MTFPFSIFPLKDMHLSDPHNLAAKDQNVNCLQEKTPPHGFAVAATTCLHIFIVGIIQTWDLPFVVSVSVSSVETAKISKYHDVIVWGFSTPKCYKAYKTLVREWLGGQSTNTTTDQFVKKRVKGSLWNQQTPPYHLKKRNWWIRCPLQTKKTVIM